MRGPDAAPPIYDMFSNCLHASGAPRPTLLSYLSGQQLGNGFGSSTDVHSVVETYAKHAQARVFLITGAASEIARALCSALVQHGATVVVGCRGDAQAGALLVDAIMCAAAAAAAPPKATAAQAEGVAAASEASGTQGQAANTQDIGQGTAGPSKRDAAQAEECSQSQLGGVSGRAIAIPCDLTTFASTRACAHAFAVLHLPLHVLVHCASTTTATFHLNADGFETHFAINHLNPLLLTLLLLPHMASTQSDTASAPSQTPTATATMERGDASDPSTCAQGAHADDAAATGPRVVWATCSAHHITYLPQRGAAVGRRLAWSVQGQQAGRMFAGPQAFGSSKLAGILAARELTARAAAAGVQVAALAAHPGITHEGLKKYGGLEPGGVLHAVQSAFADGMRMLGTLKTPGQAAATLAYAALAPELACKGDQAQAQAQPQGPAAAGSTVGPLASLDSSTAQGARWQQPAPQPRVAPCHHYLEDCALSRPSLSARSEEEAAWVYEMSVRWLLPHLGDAVQQLPVALLPGAGAVLKAGEDASPEQQL